MSNVIGSVSALGQAVVSLPALDTMKTAISGEVLMPGSEGYDEARTLWNAMVDRRPAVVVRCRNTEDIRQAVLFAKANNLLTSVRGGGHNIAGNACCDGGLMIDLSKMRSVRVDREARTVVVEPGVTLGELDAETQKYGLAVPTGINSTTGIAGLTLGGGFGWLSRRYGMTIDNLISAEVVTADGRVLVASDAENPDLFWGLRGGGGNFGVVSSFKFRLRPVGPEVLSGLVVHPFENARDLLRFYRMFTEHTPDDVTVWVVMRKAPPLPFLPEQWHGKPVLVFACCCVGDMKSGEEALRPLREYGDPIADVVGPHPFTGWQSAFDPLLTPGARNYWKTHDFMELGEGFIKELIGAVDRLPSPHCEIFIGQMGGATSRVAPEATAFRDRGVKFIMNVHGRWETPEEDAACIQWCRDLYRNTTQYATGNAYVNFMTEEEADRVEQAYGQSYQRLVELKRKYDPTNFFCMNQNIKP